MSTATKIQDVALAEDSYYKTQKIIMGGKSFKTPIKSVDIKNNIPGINTNPLIKGVNELYKLFDSKRIQDIRTTNREQEINAEISRLIRRHSSDDEVNICFTEFDGLIPPKGDELDYLTDLSYVHSDITPLPLLPKLAKSISTDNFDTYHKFIKDAIESIEVHNHKPIMGVVPIKIPSIFITNLMDTYLQKGINAFCLDFQGSTIDSASTKIRSLVKLMKKQDLFEKSFVYSLNLGSGKLPKSKEVVPAKDILSFGYGFDVIGGQHVRKYLSPEVRAKIMSSQNIFENALRLFNKSDYGYYRVTKKETVEKIYPQGSNIPLDFLETTKKHKGIDKVFNQEQQGLESVNLRGIIREEHELIKYLNKKQYVTKEDIKTLSAIKQKK